MTDEEVLAHIEGLVEEERSLRQAGAKADQARLAQIETTIDRYWDLLRQHRAQREFGFDETLVHERDAETVEHYEQ